MPDAAPLYTSAQADRFMAWVRNHGEYENRNRIGIRIEYSNWIYRMIFFYDEANYTQTFTEQEFYEFLIQPRIPTEIDGYFPLVTDP